MRKVFLEGLPRGGLNRGNRINWLKSIGYKVRFIYDDIEGWVEIVDCDGKYLYIKYLDKEPFKIFTGSFQKCKFGKLLSLMTIDFKVEIGANFKDDKRNVIIIDRKYEYGKNKQKLKYYKYRCNKCRFEGWILESNLLHHKKGCACCANQIVVESINDITTTDPWMIPYFQGGYDEAKLYTCQSSQKINPICPDCGKVRDKKIIISNIHRTKSIGCVCGDGFSYGHKYIYSLLTQLNLNFEDNKKFDWCKFQSYKNKNKQTYGEYDFIIEDRKLIVEVDGNFHRKDNKMNGQSKEESKYLDDMKDLKAHENGYRVIRIYYDDNNLEIKEYILKSELIDIFDLSSVNWLKIDEFALSNLCKKACEIKKDNPYITTVEICKIMNIDRKAITKYLKIGTKLGWCNYDPKEEMKRTYEKTSSRMIEICSKPLEMFKDGISLGVFKSASELSRQSEKLLGVKLINGCISKVCNGKTSHYKGFQFKYI